MKKRYFLLMTVMGANAQYDPTASEGDNETFSSLGVLISQGHVSDIENSVLGGTPTLVLTGPFVTSVGTGVNGEDESVLQSVSLEMNTVGFGAQNIVEVADNRVADDFEVIHGGWQIEQIEVYAYQTGEVASTITGLTMQIWDGMPGEPGSSVVFGDTTTNVLASTGYTGVLRVSETTTGTTDNRQITFNVVNVGEFFPEGTYWVDYQFTGSGGSGPWAPPVTITGIDVTGNALQQINFTSTDWNPLLDTGINAPQQGLPILIRGTEPDLIFESDFEEIVDL